MGFEHVQFLLQNSPQDQLSSCYGDEHVMHASNSITCYGVREDKNATLQEVSLQESIWIKEEVFS